MNNDTTTILLADDHAIVRRGIKALLEYEPDFAVIAEAGDGTAAWEQIEAHKPDIPVTDLCMPGMSGIELLKVIKEKSWRCGRSSCRCAATPLTSPAPSRPGPTVTSSRNPG